MPVKRLTYAEALQIVRDFIAAAPEKKVTYQALADGLPDDSRRDVLPQVNNMISSGDIKGEVVARPEGAPVFELS